MNKFFVTLIAIISLSGCTSIPKVLEGNYISSTPSEAIQNKLMDKPVRWSGLIIKTHNQKSRTCFEIVEMENNPSSLRPKRIIPQNGARFLACKEGFMEPLAFNKKLVTITGDIVAYTNQAIGEYETSFPVVKTDVIYIWQKQPRLNFMSYPSYIPLHFNCRLSVLPGYCF